MVLAATHEAALEIIDRRMLMAYALDLPFRTGEFVMKQHYFWQAVDGIGLEHLLLRQTADGHFADSWVIGEVEGASHFDCTTRCAAIGNGAHAW